MSLRGRALWGALVACVLAGAVGVGFVSHRALQLEREAREARARADLEERTRSALWRMDLALARLASQESARPESRWLEEGGWGDVVGRFELAPDGTQRGSGLGKDAGPLQWAAVSRAAGSLARVRADAVVASNDNLLQQRTDRSLADFNLRNRYAQQNLAPVGQVPAAAGLAAPIADAMTPAWVDGRLMLVRSTSGPSAPLLQGSLLDWAGLRRRLLADVADLLPAADLVPADPSQAERARTLATLPVQLIPGPLAPAPERGTPAAWIIALAWAALAVSLGGIVALVAGTAALSERRAAFVSAVSHELRTPLTTFRMYAEMLEAGMVPPQKQPEYLRTLRVESERLGRLVENVLSYARVEGGRAPAPQVLQLGPALERIVPRLADRAAAAGMTLTAPAPEVLTGLTVLADPTSLDQVLFNLVENACKYAAGATDKRIHLEVDSRGSKVEGGLGPRGGRGASLTLTVRDHGPGVAADVRGRLFTAFAKSAQQAADSAAGVGLGLALSRRLARAMGGDLRLGTGADGARFEVRLQSPDAGKSV